MLEHLKDELNTFRKRVIQQAKSNLTKTGKNASKRLYNSLDSDLKGSPNSFQLDFTMADYGEFVDKGVSGVEKKYNTPFNYKSKRPPLKPIQDWVTRRRFQFRNRETGKFMSFKSTAYLVAGGILKNGIKPSLFFTKPFQKAFERMPDELVEAYGLDVEQFLQYTINKK